MEAPPPGPPTPPTPPAERHPPNGWDRKIILLGLVGTVWGCLVLAAVGMAFGLRIPRQLWMVAGFSLGIMAALLRGAEAEWPSWHQRGK